MGHGNTYSPRHLIAVPPWIATLDFNDGPDIKDGFA
jgi:hypothetical protein